MVSEAKYLNSSIQISEYCHKDITYLTHYSDSKIFLLLRSHQLLDYSKSISIYDTRDMFLE